MRRVVTGTGRNGEPDRSELRQRLRAERRSIAGERRREAELRINAALVEQLEESGRPAGRVALSLPTDGEVDLGPAMRHLHDAGWQVHLPVVGPERAMRFGPWRPGAPLGTNRFGIDEPTGVTVRDADELDVVVLPCVGVDAHGHRLGFGAGFYDRALADAPATMLVAVAFEVQVLDHIEPEAHDVPVHLVVTEVAVRRTPDAV